MIGGGIAVTLAEHADAQTWKCDRGTLQAIAHAWHRAWLFRSPNAERLKWSHLRTRKSGDLHYTRVLELFIPAAILQ